MIIADENLDARIIKILRDNDYSIFSIAEELHGISDNEVIDIARKTESIIFTEDKDFGEWVFSHKVKNLSIVFLRFHHSEYQEIAKVLVELLKSGIENLQNRFTTVTTKKIRSRRL
jgi:predicted nuclease of predicted toxin-antitoxin system